MEMDASMKVVSGVTGADLEAEETLPYPRTNGSVMPFVESKYAMAPPRTLRPDTTAEMASSKSSALAENARTRSRSGVFVRPARMF